MLGRVPDRKTGQVLGQVYRELRSMSITPVAGELVPFAREALIRLSVFLCDRSIAERVEPPISFTAYRASHTFPSDRTRTIRIDSASLP